MYIAQRTIEVVLIVFIPKKFQKKNIIAKKDDIYIALSGATTWDIIGVMQTDGLYVINAASWYNKK